MLVELARLPSDGSNTSPSAAATAESDVHVTTIMIVGDSISQGREGDWTWRYRLWQWLRTEGVAARFVGPYRGTVPPDLPEPPHPPPLPCETPAPPAIRASGGYASGVCLDFLGRSSAHFSVWGWQAAQAKDLVAAQVAVHRPDYVLVELGFNDLGWFVSGPEGTLASVEAFIRSARAAKPDLRFAVANVPQRTRMAGRDDLPVATDAYNRILEDAVPRWGTPESPVELVRLRDHYSSDSSSSFAASYDGLHPNALGEYQIAKAFSHTLVGSFHIGRRPLNIPPLECVPERPHPRPANVSADATPGGVVVTWDPVYGAFGYDVRARLLVQGLPEPSSHTDDGENWTLYSGVPSNRHDTTRCLAGQKWAYQARTRAGDALKSDWTDTVCAVANPHTAPGPSDIVTHATATGLAIRWSPPAAGDWGEIDRYGVITWDQDAPGSFPAIVGVRGNQNRATIEEGLTPGHHYGVAVETWTVIAGGGFPAPARPVTVGAGTPSAPHDVRVVVVDETTADIFWEGDDTVAAGYRCWVRRRRSSSDDPDGQQPPSYRDGPPFSGRRRRLGGLFPSVRDFAFGVTAFNGNDESAMSDWVVVGQEG